MEDLVQSQIKEACRLTMPEGLKELMSDISREVLRAQPADLYGFIADYLSALLVTRDNLTVATLICRHVCHCDCRPELLRALIDIGLSETDASAAQNVIMKHFSKDKVEEANLVALILANTNIDASMVPAVIKTLRTAYLSHQAHNFTKYETSSDSSDRDEIAMAAKHTLKLYKQTRPNKEMYQQMATKIQASYRAYGVRRSLRDDQSFVDSRTTSRESSFSEDVKQEMEMTASMSKRRMNTVSSLSLAGSYCTLATHKPYNVHEVECLSQLEETSEKEHAHIDYTARSPHVSVVNDEKDTDKKKISFQDGANTKEKLDDDSIQETNYGSLDDLILIIDDDYKNRSDSIESIDSDGYDADVNEEELETQTAYTYVNVMNKEVDSESDDDYD